MKLFRNFLWLIVVLLILQVIKVVLSRLHFPAASLGEIIVGCSQFLLLLGAVFITVFAWIVRRFFKFRKPFYTGVLVFAGWMVLLESLFAWWMHSPARMPYCLRPSFAWYYDYYMEDLLQFDPRYAVYNSDLFYTMKPDAAFRFQNIEFDDLFQTNRLGLRDHDSSLLAPEIACIGDSYTTGWGVGQEESFPARLRTLSGLRVLNMGVPSYGTAREIINLGRVDTSRLRWIILQYCTNDLSENETAGKSNYTLPISSHAEYDQLVREVAFSRVYFPGKYSLIIMNFFLKSLINRIHPFFNLHWDRKDGLQGQERQAKLFLDILYHSAIDFKKTGVVVTMMDDCENMKGVFLSEVKHISGESPYRERFGDRLKVINIAPLLGPEDLYLLDMHFKASGQDKIARAILDSIKGNGW